MNKAFDTFQWKNAPSTDTPLNQTNLNKINNALDTVDTRVVSLNNAVGTSVETIGNAALYAHAKDSFFYTSDMKIYKATVAISVGTILTVGTNCSLDCIVNNLGGNGGGSSSIVTYTQTLSVGSTSVSFTNLPTTGTWLGQIFTYPYIDYSAIDNSTAGTVVVTFDAQQSAVTVILKLEEVQ